MEDFLVDSVDYVGYDQDSKERPLNMKGIDTSFLRAFRDMSLVQAATGGNAALSRRRKRLVSHFMHRGHAFEDENTRYFQISK